MKKLFWSILLFSASFALYLYYGMHPLWYEEAMYAEVPREMLRGGGFLFPTLNYAAYIFKPPLYLWAGALSQALLGQGPLGVRLPTALFAACTVVFAFLIGSRDSLKAGVFSGAALATFYGFVFHSSAMLTDIPLALFVAAAAYFFLKSEDGSKWAVRCVYVCLGLAVMTKGLVGLIFPGIAFAVYITIGRRRDALRRFIDPVGMLLFLAAVVPWHVVMEIKNPGFLKNYVLNEQILRFFNKRYPPDTDSVSTPWFILATLGWLMPWAAFILQSIFGARGGPARFARCWAIGGMVFLCLSSSKMEYYSLPLLPALAVIIGAYWAGTGQRPGQRSGANIGAYILAIAALAGALAAPFSVGFLASNIGVSHETAGTIARIALISNLTLAIGLFVAGRLWAVGKRDLAFGALLACATLFSITAHGAINLVGEVYSIDDAARAVSGMAKPSDVLVMDGPKEYEYIATYNYCLKRKAYILPNGPDPILSTSFSEKDRFVLTDDEFKRLWLSGRRVFFAVPPDFGRGMAGGVSGVPGSLFYPVYKGSQWVYTNKL